MDEPGSQKDVVSNLRNGLACDRYDLAGATMACAEPQQFGSDYAAISESG